MSRLPKIPVEQWPADLVEAMQAGPMTDTERGVAVIFAHHPAILKGLLSFGATLAGNTSLSPRLQEFIRLRLAYHNQCDLCIRMRYKSAYADGMTDEMVRALENPQASPLFSDAEKAAIEYCDLTATDHLAITQDFDNFRRYFSVKEIVELGTFIAFFDGFGRLEAIWEPLELVPESYHDRTQERAPWINEGELVRR